MRRESAPLTSIRGVAALWVVLDHYHLTMSAVGYNLWPGLSHYGYTGVDIFFVLSGFILTAVYRDLAARKVCGFLVRRVFRIYPMHLAVLCSMVFLWIDTYLRFGVYDQSQQLRWLPACALLLQPFIYHRLMWNSATWSLSIEFICYLAFPIAIYVLRNQRLLILSAVALALAFSEHRVQIYGLYIWGVGAVKRGLAGFGLGMTLRLIGARLPRPSPLLATTLELASLTGIAAVAAVGEGPFIPLFAALLILSLSYESGIIARLLSGRFWLWFGKISFSLYLIHQVLIGPMWMSFPATKLPLPHAEAGMVWTIAIIGLCLALSTLTWRLIEEPLRQLGSRVARRVDGMQHPNEQTSRGLLDHARAE